MSKKGCDWCLVTTRPVVTRNGHYYPSQAEV
jgi:hypothetical protein